MAEAPNESALIKFGPIAAWIGGGLLMVVFVLLAVVLGDTEAPKRKIDDAVSQVNSKLNDPKPSAVVPEFSAEGLNGADQAFGVVKGGKIPSKIADEHKILDLPTQFRVFLEAPVGAPDFDGSDADSDGRLSPTEYANTQKALDGIKFRTLDTNKDGYLTKTEYDTNPSTQDIEFDKYDTNDDGKLTRVEYENGTGSSDFEDKDKNKDKLLDRVEYGARPTVNPDADLAPPVDVKAAADAKSFVINVSWTAPSLKDAPADLGYWVMRKSKADIKERELRYNTVDLPAHRKKEDAWRKDFQAWKALPGNEGKSEPDYEKDPKGRVKPVAPPRPSEWERLNDTPLTELTFADVSFKAEYTYVYAVRATTKSKLKEGTKSDDTFAADYHTSDAAVMAGRPVVVFNRIQLSWLGKSDVARIKLRKFHPIGGVWRAVEVIVSVGQGEEVGASGKASALKGRGYEIAVVDAEGKANAEWYKALEASGDVLDFATGWIFNQFTGSDMEFGQKGSALRFVLPRDTKDPASKDNVDPSGMANPLGVRVICVGKGGASARFEITRWKQVGNQWYRIVAYQDVKKGDAVGYAEAAIGGLGKDMIQFFDDGGVPADADKLGLRAISMETGLVYGGIEKRTLEMGEGKMDIWGVYYVDK